MGFINEEKRDICLIFHTGHRQQKVVRLQTTKKFPAFQALVKDSFPEIDTELKILLRNPDDSFLNVEDQTIFSNILNNTKADHPVMFTIVKDEVVEAYDAYTKDLFIEELLSQKGCESEDIDKDKAYLMFLQSCGFTVPDRLEEGTYRIWYPAIQKYIASYLLHKFKRYDIDDRAVFGSSFALNGKTAQRYKGLYKTNHISAEIQPEYPVLAAVTDSTASIVVEMDQDASVTCSLVPPSTDISVSSKSANLKAKVPYTFSFTGLAPATNYVVVWDGVKNHHKHSIDVDTKPS
mmetsp:Transcript_9478/g.14016  ORF Transcript_9478/g.14016 Transcript_9478/m.14016 type:complete len:292 (-) Transcript_9478:34-909(-)